MKDTKKISLILFAGLLAVSTAAADDIEPPPLPGEDGEVDTEPEDPPSPGEGTEDAESDEEVEGTSDFDPDRVDQDRSVEEPEDDHSEGGVQRTGVSGVIHGIFSSITGILPFYNFSNFFFFHKEKK